MSLKNDMTHPIMISFPLIYNKVQPSLPIALLRSPQKSPPTSWHTYL